MLAYCTYCSAHKKSTSDQIPAIELYASKRISKVFNAAKKARVHFIILSGKYGIIDAHQEIETYDHLLLASEIEVHADLIATQIKSKNIHEIVFFMNSIKKDRNLAVYLECIQSACHKSGTFLVIKEGNYND